MMLDHNYDLADHEYVCRGEPLSAAEALELRDAVAEIGDHAVASLMGCSRQAVARAAARFAVNRGTAALVRLYLAARRQAA
jgi:hypothetical protein